MDQNLIYDLLKHLLISNAWIILFFLFLDTILQIKNMSSLYRETRSYRKCWKMSQFLRLLLLSTTAVARDEYFS